MKIGPRNDAHRRNGDRCTRRNQRTGLLCGTSARWLVEGVGASCTKCLGGRIERVDATAFQVTRLAPKGVKATSV